MKAAIGEEHPVAAAVDLAAEGMLRNFGIDADNQAQIMAHRCIARRDKQGERMWLAIGTRIIEIRSAPRG